MSLSTVLRASVASWLTSSARLNLQRTLAEFSRKIRRQPHTIHYFHRADDPYCQLMVQVLPDIASRFAVEIKPLVVEQLPANMYPDPARYEAYSIIDAARLARLYGLGFVEDAVVPDRLAVGMVNRFLASKQQDPQFFQIAEEMGAALWRRDLDTVRRTCGLADLGDAQLEANQRFLRDVGHYASASLHYAGEFFVGVDRLDHLERRLNKLGLGDGEVEFEVQRLWRYELENLERSVTDQSVEVYFSVRSPYSFVGLQLIHHMAQKTGVRVDLKPVLPMLMRGMKVPPAKGRYILFDTAREARLENVDFGHICDPLGEATWRAMQIGFALMDDEKTGGKPGQAFEFFRSFTKGVWAQGIDGTSDAGLSRILSNAGLSNAWIGKALDRAETEQKAEANRQEMFRHGSWGVPTFRAGGETFWGQDRMWAIVDALKQ
ncbi:MAG: DsbA family protein [Kordiimonadaceae bacterium]|nr:DsbA family protein [Kordiimonadaceae bacterium]MBO6567189.1 DsbA family protein [Kordiimonadaceae bacterium]MBO6963596.1 DsbA family protein [Kordiimonadaceae bacterium]